MRPAIVLFTAMVLASVPNADSHASAEAAQSAQSWIAVVDAVRDAIVVIETENGQGSGFLVRSNGTIVTNQHVIADAKKIKVSLRSGEIFRRAHLLTADKSRDLAILRVEGFDLPVLPLGNSNDCKVGQEVLLFGSPKGLEQTVSNGVISAIRLSEGGTRTIQTSAAASPGSSGGALLNRSGEVIGVLSFKRKGGENLNFAVAINYVSGMLESLERGELSISERVLDSSDQEELMSARGGVLLSGYGPGDEFHEAFLTAMNFLASRSVRIANRPSVHGDEAALPYALESARVIGADSLLYLTMPKYWKAILQCFEPEGKMIWEESVSVPIGMTRVTIGRHLRKKIKRALDPHVGDACCPITESSTKE